MYIHLPDPKLSAAENLLSILRPAVFLHRDFCYGQNRRLDGAPFGRVNHLKQNHSPRLQERYENRRIKNFTRQNALIFLAAAATGFVFHLLSIPIPYMLFGIVVTFVSKTFINPQTNWLAAWRNLMLSVGGCARTG